MIVLGPSRRAGSAYPLLWRLCAARIAAKPSISVGGVSILQPLRFPWSKSFWWSRRSRPRTRHRTAQHYRLAGWLITHPLLPDADPATACFGHVGALAVGSHQGFFYVNPRRHSQRDSSVDAASTQTPPSAGRAIRAWWCRAWLHRADQERGMRRQLAAAARPVSPAGRQRARLFHPAHQPEREAFTDGGGAPRLVTRMPASTEAATRSRRSRK